MSTGFAGREKRRACGFAGKGVCTCRSGVYMEREDVLKEGSLHLQKRSSHGEGRLKRRMEEKHH